MSKPAPSSRRILISVLNWNCSDETAACVRSLAALKNRAGHLLDIVVIDNGSRAEEWTRLQQSLAGADLSLLRNEQNLGFAGGHNIALRRALDSGADYAWLVNSDAVVKPDALDRLVELIDADPRCGATSPLILARDDESVIDFCGARHDWPAMASVSSTSVEETRQMEAQYPRDMWLMGAALMLRVEALREVGLLNDSYFAYWEDNDISARLSAKGWLCRMAFDAVVLHCHPRLRMSEKGPYYFYLMARNSFKFWYQHTPAPYRRMIRLKLIDRALLVANRLRNGGYDEKCAACMLGVYDSQTGKSGKWNLERKVPWVVEALRRALWRNHARHFRPGDA
ncbi:glycosyltransferase family 2 protein [Massilia sp. IC2-476]|uniref:glycosyltransferase family 2 protein n=1 Tax=Massilia sp. IC2-476 TaxID=2887199 RepID=UPI001D100C7C|nr:glycosyltransferase family 2 protein [Massilia sp. IC2-476]MCC2973042.1 glycosyltransferase family 2 protein [Massilia sp. IC2-476]